MKQFHSFLFLTSLMSCTAAIANERGRFLITDPGQYNPSLQCWYEDKRYSEGAVINIADQTLICTAKKPELSNSELIWLSLTKDGTIVYPKQEKRVRVN